MHGLWDREEHREERMNELKKLLRAQNYQDAGGFFSLASPTLGGSSHQAEEVWTACASINPIHAAAATTSADPFAKYPAMIDSKIPDEDIVVLDAGCGYGRIAIPLLKKRPRIQIVGVDASPKMLQEFLRLLELQGHDLAYTDRLLLLHSPIQELPFPDEIFDYIYSCAVLLHNPYQDVQQILQEFQRLLKPTGTLWLQGSFPNIANLEGIQNAVYLKFHDESTVNGPVRVYTQARVTQLFASWSAVSIFPTGRIVIPRHMAKIPLPFGKAIRRFNAWGGGNGVAFIQKIFPSLFIQHFDVEAIP
ncbi:methyltransferase domain-containing protein [candidate division KSB3 bacterium]|uniref:Methyltransferase domain-containing protein n=1 Tax=candidate division KSB3 bacterium TaxID=2044937 RepID=A0A9D5JVI1_9BACT|nr:methyltransferase domain-containing protein [candidate division KSB3 bacterium]MBD3324904.1 methyltransferase domain-containing protein [candidate division KSB3 bacterium]